MRQQEISSAELEAKRIILNAKKDILDKTFQETLKDSPSMDPKEKPALYKKILANGKNIIHKPKVFCPKGEPISSRSDGDVSRSPRPTWSPA